MVNIKLHFSTPIYLGYILYCNVFAFKVCLSKLWAHTHPLFVRHGDDKYVKCLQMLVWSWWDSLVCCSLTDAHFALPDFESCQQSSSFRTPDRSSAETCREGRGGGRLPCCKSLWEHQKRSPELRFATSTPWVWACVFVCVLMWALPPHLSHIIHPEPFLSVWKFGLHSWNPTKNCHPLIVIIALARSRTKTPAIQAHCIFMVMPYNIAPSYGA